MRCLHAIRPILFAGKTTIWRTLPLVALIMICLTGAIQVKTFVGSLQTPEGDLFAERAGRLVLARNRGHAAPQIDGWHGVWKISSPYFKTATGKFLAIEQSEQGVKVSLADESSESTRWVIDVIESTSPKRSTSRGLVEGESRSKFRLSISSGR